MSVNSRLFTCTPEAVFRVLDDGWLYAGWVVGASRIRDVDPSWPAVGTDIHHSVGSWPLLLDDTTSVEKYVPGEVMILRARAWPSGEATVLIEVRPTPGGCRVSIFEDVVAGPAKFIPQLIRTPMLHWRNTESLRRLAFLAEGRSKPGH
jgi:transglutaminase-like putative cysteine protease